MSDINVIVVTPEATVVDAKTSFVVLPFFDGEVGIAANHAPLIGRLGCGELRFEESGKTVRYFVDSGFVQIADNVVSIMAERAVAGKDIKLTDAEERLSAANAESAHGDEIAEREKRVGKARAMIRVASRDRS